MSDLPAWLGANFWSRAGGPRMWSRYDGAVVRDELAVLAEHGLNVTRSFCFWPDFVPGARACSTRRGRALRGLPRRACRGGSRDDPDVRRRAHVRRELGPALAAADATSTATSGSSSQQAWLAAELARRVRRAPGRRRLARLERDAALRRHRRRATRSRPGHGSSSRRSAPAAHASRSRSATARGASRCPAPTTATRCARLRRSSTSSGRTRTRCRTTRHRQALAAAFACELAGGFGKPVVLEEFGVTSDFAADEHAADYYRQVLHTTLLAGATRLARLEQLRLRRPRAPRTRTATTCSRCTSASPTATGRPKPQLHALARVRARSLERARRRGLGAGQGRRGARRPRALRARASVHDARRTAQDIRDSAPPVVRRRARGGPPRRARPRARRHPGDGAPLPGARARSCSPPRASSACASSRPAARRSTSRTSPAARPTSAGRGSRGSTSSSASGTGCATASSTRSRTTSVDFELRRGARRARRRARRLTFRVAGEPSARCYLPVEPAGAEVVAVDAHGRPALLRHALGAGRTVLCTYPLEHMAARTPRVNPEDTWRLYSALAESAGVVRPVSVADPRILAGAVRHGGSDDGRPRQLLRRADRRRARPGRGRRCSRSRADRPDGRSRDPRRGASRPTSRPFRRLTKGVIRSGPREKRLPTVERDTVRAPTPGDQRIDQVREGGRSTS